MNSNAFAVEFSSAAGRDLKRLDPPVRFQLLRAAQVLKGRPYPSPEGRIKQLAGIVPPHFRLRVSDYRIVYRIERKKVVVIRVAHRREVYR